VIGAVLQDEYEMQSSVDLPRISFLVPGHGVAAFLGDALSSLQSQSVKAWEAVVVDDGVPNDIERAARQFSDDTRVRFLNTRHGGPSVARNYAAAASRAPILALLDGDDMVEPDYAEKMIEAFDAQPDLAFVTCDATYFGKGNRVGARYSSYYPQSEDITLDSVLSRKFCVFVGSSIRRSAFVSINGFDETLSCAEDLDLWIRLLSCGPARCIGQPLARYRRRAGSLSSDVERLAAAERCVYQKAYATLDADTGKEVALQRLNMLMAEQSWRDGERLILSGSVQEGLKYLAGREGQSTRWRIALSIMRAVPFAARPLMNARRFIPEAWSDQS
jgi:hypothetical protein